MIYFILFSQSRVNRKQFDFARLRLLDSVQKGKGLSSEEVDAVTAHLATNVDAFKRLVGNGGLAEAPGSDPYSRVRDIVLKASVLEITNSTEMNGASDADGAPPDVAVAENEGQATGLDYAHAVLYRRNKVETFCTLVLSGRLQIVAGQDEFRSEAGPFSVIAAQALTTPAVDGYTSDFTVRMSPQCPIIYILSTAFVCASLCTHFVFVFSHTSHTRFHYVGTGVGFTGGKCALFAIFT